MLRRIPAIAAAISGFVLYWMTAYPAPDWLDGPALAAASFRLGVFHPPGSPLAVMCGHLCMLWPFGSVAACFPMLPALFAGAALYVLARTLDDIFSALGPSCRPLRPGAVFLLTVAFGLTPAFWSQSIRYEVYPLAALLFLCAMRPLCQRALQQDEASPDQEVERSLIFTGMCVAVHPLIACCALLATAPFAVDVARSPRRLCRALGCLALGAAPMALLPLMVGAPVDLRWGDPATPGGWFSFILGRTFSPSFTSAPAAIQASGSRVLVIVADGVGLALVALSLLGLYLVLRHRWKLALALLLALAASAASLFLQRSVRIDNPDATGYALPAMLATLLLAACGLAATGRAVERAAGSVRRGAWVTIGLAVFVLSAHAAWTIHPFDRSGCHAGKTASARTLSCLPEHTVMLLGDFNLVFMFDYLQQVEGMRPDVVSLYLRDLSNQALRNELSRTNPDLARRLPDTENLDREDIELLARAYPVAFDLGPHIDANDITLAGACGLVWWTGNTPTSNVERSLGQAQQRYFLDLSPPVCDDGAMDPRTADVVAWHTYWQARTSGARGMRRLAAVLLRVAACSAPFDATIADAARRLEPQSRTCEPLPQAGRCTSGPGSQRTPFTALLLFLGLVLWGLPLAAGPPTKRRLMSCLLGLCLLAAAVALAG